MKEQIIQLINQGYNKKEISLKLNVGYSTVRKYSQGIESKRSNTAFICRTCGDSNKSNFYKSKNRNTYYCKKCWNKKTYDHLKTKIVDYMNDRGGAHCQKCGYDKCIAALEFHHRDPSKKDPTWRKGWGMGRLKNELDKCDILCSNCHREEHNL